MSDTGRSFVLGKTYAKRETGIFIDPSELPPVTWIKRLKGAPTVSLPWDMPDLGSVDHAFAVMSGAEPPREPTAGYLPRLAALLYYNEGVLRWEAEHIFNPHRGIPSARAFYPSELYAWIPEGKPLPSGLYHYLSVDHKLEQVRVGGREWLEATLGVDIADQEVDAVLLVAAEFWRISHKYGDFGYRLCSLEAGHLAGNLLLTAAALGWDALLRYHFRDDLLATFTGAPPAEEAIMAAVIIGRDLPDALRHGEQRPAPDGPGPLLGTWEGSHGTGATRQTAWLRELEQAVHLKDFADVRLAPVGQQRVTPGAQIRSLGPCDDASDRGLVAALYDRNSGHGGGLTPMTTPLPHESASRTLKNGLLPYASDLSEERLGRPAIELYVAAIRVKDVEPGVYRYLRESHGLEVISLGSPAEPLHELYMLKEAVNVRTHSMVLFLSYDMDAAFQRWGDRGYRIAHLEAGLACQWLTVCSTLNGVYARGSCSLVEHMADQLLGTTNTPLVPIYQLLVGINRSLGFQLDLHP